MKYLISLVFSASLICFSVFTACSQQSQWSCLGPDSLPAIGGDSSYFLNYTQGIGRTTCIRFHPFYNGNSNKTVFIGTPRGGLWRSYSGETQWQEMNTSRLPNMGVSDLIFHPFDTAHLYIVTGDADNGLNQHEASEGTEDTQSRGIFESTDGGNTWSEHSLGTWHDEQQHPIAGFWDFPSLKIMRRMVVHPVRPEVMVAIVYKYNHVVNKFQSYVYRSTNGGKSWFVTYSYTGDNFQDIETKPGNPDVMYISGRNLFKSPDAGLTWTKITSDAFPADSMVVRCKAGVTIADPRLLYSMFVTGRTAKLYISRDEGVSFTLAVQGTGSPPWRTALAIDPNNPYSVYYSGGNFISRFSFDGDRWKNAGTRENLHADIHELAFSPEGKKLYVSSDGGVYIADTPDADPAWRFVGNGIGNAAVWRLGTSAKNPNHIIAGLQDCGTMFYDKERYATSGGWAIIRGGDGAESMIDYMNDSVMYHNDGQNNVFARSDDGGKRWEYISPRGETGSYLKPALQDPADHNTIYVGFHDIYKSSDRGKTWIAISDFSSFGKSKNEKAEHLAIAPSNPNILYAAFSQPTWGENSKGKLFCTMDGGQHWKDITTGLTGADYSSINALAVDPNDAAIVYLGFRGGWKYKVMRSLNGGLDASWEDYSGDLPKEADVNAIVIDKRKKGGLYIGTHIGVYERKSFYSGWIPFMDGTPLHFPNTRVTDLEINYTSSELFAATLGRGVWKTAIHDPDKKKMKKRNKRK